MAKDISLKEWIAHQGVKIVAEKMGTSETTVRHWRRGHCLPKSDQMLKLKRLSNDRVSCDRMIEDFFSGRN